MEEKQEGDYLVTSESVTEGHPDKVCDQISDAILDAYLAQDPKSRVAVETMVSTDMVVLAGEVTSKGKVDVAKTARDVIREIGYTEKGKGFDADTCMIFTNIHSQSPDISMGVGKSGEGEPEVIGGGDQGIMYGYASSETENLMPLPCTLANKLAMQLAAVRKQGKADFLYPDGKSQVTMRCRADGTPVSIESIVISAQHSEAIPRSVLEAVIRCLVIEPVIDRKWLTSQTRIHINPTGRFVIGGPAGDTGVTGRKIMVDTYGTIGKHGGGAFSGKDPTKVDRSAAYMARYTAKNIVAAGLADRCEVALAYVIGGVEPEAVTINTFGTGKIPDSAIAGLVENVFSFGVADIISQLELRKPQFRKTAAYGHFGREDQGFKWEDTDKAWILKQLSV
ncbi:methionine adenosyltransferase [Clostridium sp. AM29-11AC]|uniref:methionine adenosyltransferase n=1 Tax=Clostridium sp. AM29-11AC TaxID=2293028 RepID=UPI000E4BC676|nr:methionine adenosyltransferase [Clostridium sp. AM29-11AC]RHT57695.1 methionine adenosyltransferase [Clostridium sp. AM29-11AC]